MNRPIPLTAPIVALALVNLLWLSSLAPALATTVTDTFPLKLTGTEWCRNDPKFVEPIKVKTTDGMTVSLTHHALINADPTDIQATIDTHGDKATIDAITLHGRALRANKAGLTAQLVLSGTDPGNPDHFMTLRGTATFDKAGILTKMTGTYVYQILSGSGVVPNSDCFGSGAFGTGKQPRFDLATLEAYVKASNTTGVDEFGSSVALSGDTLAIGAWKEGSAGKGVNGSQNERTVPGQRSGAVYVFTRNKAGHWSQQAYLKPSNTQMGEQFGVSVALAGDTLAVGAPGEASNGDPTNNNVPASGAVYVFTRTSGVWNQQAYVKASNIGQNDNFGVSVALDGDTLAVGAWGEASANGDPNNNNALGSGAVYVFTRASDLWSQQAYVKASNIGQNDRFGWSVALAGDTLAVGAPLEDSNAKDINTDNQADNSATDSGAVYVFTRNMAREWHQQAYVKASNTGALANFGWSVALAGDTLAVGAQGENSLNGSQAGGGQRNGAVYVFTRASEVWSQQAYVKASNSEPDDEFGFSVALAGDTLAVGAHFEDGGAKGVNGKQDLIGGTSGRSNSGAVYVFTRSGMNWSQQAYVKASNTGSGDQFGFSVALASDTLAVGALSESSDAKGVNGDQTNKNAQDSGAGYVYRAH